MDKPKPNFQTTPDKQLAQTVEQHKGVTIHDLGWTKEKAAQVRAQLSAFAEDWDDPSMDAYDALSRGDVVLVNFPFADLTGIKRRPALVVQANNLNNGLTHCILAMITSNVARASHASRVFVAKADSAYKATNLLSGSVIMPDHLATIDEAIIDRRLGVVTNMAPVDTALRTTLAL